MKQSKLPKVVPCGNKKCARRLEMEKYGPSNYAPAGTPLDRIHAKYDPTTPAWGVECWTCGHYTESVPMAWSEEIERKWKSKRLVAE